jgi:hypothetical protein
MHPEIKSSLHGGAEGPREVNAVAEKKVTPKAPAKESSKDSTAATRVTKKSLRRRRRR